MRWGGGGQRGEDLRSEFFAHPNLITKTLHWVKHTVESLCGTYCRIIVVRGGLMFVDFVGDPYPRIYVFSNLYFLIEISKHHFFIIENSL